MKSKNRAKEKKMPGFDPSKPMPGVVHLPPGFRLLGKWGGGVCLALAVGFVWFAPWFALFWAALSLGFGGLLLAYRNWCVLYNQEGFETVSILGSSRKCGYDQISAAAGSYLFLLSGGKVRRLRIIKSAVGRMEFLSSANREYRKIHGNRPIPMARREKRPGIFRGNVKEPWRYILAYSLILSALVFLLVATVVAARPLSPENTRYARLTFTGGEEYYRFGSGRGLWLESPGYDLNFFYRNDDGAMDGVPALCDGETEFDVYYTRGRTRKKAIFFSDSRYTIWAMTGEDGTPYLTFEQTNAQRAKLRIQCLWISLPPLALWLVYVALAIYVGRNPEKFKPKTVYWFFKKNTIVWKGCFQNGTD